MNSLFLGILSSKAKMYLYLIYWHLRDCPAHKGLSDLGHLVPHIYDRRHGWSFMANENVPKDLLHRLENDVIDQTMHVGSAIRETNYRKVIKRSYEHKGQSYHYIVKIYLSPRWKDFLRTLFQDAKGFREWKTAWRLKHRDIMTPEPILYAERSRWGGVREGIFVAQEIRPAKDVLSYAQTFAKKDLRQRRRVILSMAQFLAHMHNRGFVHGDLHAANILLAQYDNQRAFYVVDLHRSRFVRNVSLRQVVMNMVYLYSSVGDQLSRSDMVFFLKQYQQERDYFPYHWIAYFDNIPRIAKLVCAQKKPLIRFYPLRMAQVKRNLHGEWMPRYRRLFAQLPNLMRSSDYVASEHVLKQSAAYRVFRELSLTGHLCCKQVLGYSIKKIGRMHREWMHSVRLFYAGISVPKPLAYLYRKRILVSRYIGQSMNADEFFYRYLTDPKDKARYAFCLGQFIGELHRRHVFHSDLKAANILVLKHHQHKWLFYLIDHGRVAMDSPLTQRHVLKNITQIWGSFPEGVTSQMEALFFRAYRRKNPILAEYVISQRSEIYKNKQQRLKMAGYGVKV